MTTEGKQRKLAGLTPYGNRC